MKITTIIMSVLMIFLLVGTSLADPNDLGSLGGGNDLGNLGGANDLGNLNGGNDLGNLNGNEPINYGPGYDLGNNPDMGNFNPPIVPNDPIYSNPTNPPSQPILDEPAKWDSLQTQKIIWHSPDNTVVYKDLKNLCEDKDTPVKIFNVASQHQYYQLFFLNNDLVIKNLAYSYAGTENVVVECNGVPAKFALIVEGNAAPNAQFTYSPTNPSTRETIQFTDLSTDANGQIVAWSWDFGDGEKSTTKNPTHRYTQSGTYQVTLTVWDNEDAMGQQSQSLTVTQGTPGPVSISDRTIFKRVRFNEYAQAGDVLDLDVTVFNDGTYNMEDMKVTAYIFGLESIQTVGPFDIDDSDEENALFHLDIPADAQPGTYDLRITASNDDFQHNEHRTLTII